MVRFTDLMYLYVTSQHAYVPTSYQNKIRRRENGEMSRRHLLTRHDHTKICNNLDTLSNMDDLKKIKCKNILLSTVLFFNTNRIEKQILKKVKFTYGF